MLLILGCFSSPLIAVILATWRGKSQRMDEVELLKCFARDSRMNVLNLSSLGCDFAAIIIHIKCAAFLNATFWFISFNPLSNCCWQFSLCRLDRSWNLCRYEWKFSFSPVLVSTLKDSWKQKSRNLQSQAIATCSLSLALDLHYLSSILISFSFKRYLSYKFFLPLASFLHKHLF